MNWRGERVGITGVTGAIGSRLARRLAEAGANVIGLSRTRPEGVLEGTEHRCADVRDIEGMRAGLRGCSAVFHLAGEANASVAAADPVECFGVNLEGTTNVMYACGREGAGRVIFASTGHVYGRTGALPVREDHATRPLSIYAASKLAAEAIVGGCAECYGMSAVIARLSNVYGGPVKTETVIGRCLDAMAHGQPVRLRSHREVRDFLYIDDAAEALLRLGQAEGRGAGVVNVSTGRGSSIAEMLAELKAAAREAGFPEPVIAPEDGAPDERTPVFVMDNSKLRELVGWSPETTLREGLARELKLAAASVLI